MTTQMKEEELTELKRHQVQLNQLENLQTQENINKKLMAARNKLNKVLELPLDSGDGMGNILARDVKIS